MNIGNLYSHDPRHYWFARQMDSFSPIEDCGARGDKIVGWVSVIIAVVLVVM